MHRVQILGTPRSTYVRVCCIVAIEKGIDYELVPVPLHAPVVERLHPFGKVPVLRHGDLVIVESRAIVGYLDRVFPGPKLIPEDPVAAARVEQWVSLVNTTIDPVLIRRYALGYVMPGTPDGTPDRARIDASLPEVERHLGILADAVAENGHLVGDGFTYADANLVPMLQSLTKLPESGAIIARSGALTAFLAKHAARPSVAAMTNPPTA
ncbi:glutathione S-transferase family protein [Methyloraptor flagellatus]|uniref:glutathione transferase n=1 Tax=Methyloraptor flagellatus TaxID=3162530 RepID=A0AAU7XBT1_9HYPH